MSNQCLHSLFSKFFRTSIFMCMVSQAYGGTLPTKTAGEVAPVTTETPASKITVPSSEIPAVADPPSNVVPPDNPGSATPDPSAPAGDPQQKPQTSQKTQQPPITKSAPAQAALPTAAATGAAIDQARAQSLEPAAINNLNTQARQAAAVDAALLQEAQSGKWDNSNLPALLGAMGALVSRPALPQGADSSGNSNSGSDAGDLLSYSDPTAASNSSTVPAPISPADASSQLLQTLTDGLSNLFSDNLQGGLNHEVVALTIPSSQDTGLTLGNLPADGAANGSSPSLSFDDSAGTTAQKNKAKADDKSAADNTQTAATDAAAAANSGNSITISELTKEVIKDRIKDFINKKLAEQSKTPKEQNVKDLLAAVKSDSGTYDKFIDTMADKMAANIKIQPASKGLGVTGLTGFSNAEIKLAGFDDNKIGDKIKSAIHKEPNAPSRNLSSEPSEPFGAKSAVLGAVLLTVSTIIFGEARARRKRNKLASLTNRKKKAS